MAVKPWVLLTFGIDPVGVAVGQRGAVTQLLYRLRRFMVYLEERARPPPTGRVLFCHLVHTSSTRRISTRVVGDGTLEEDWGRQFGGIVGNSGRSRIVSPTARADRNFGRGGERGGFLWVRRVEPGRQWHDQAVREEGGGGGGNRMS